jgi:phytoene dehydrogenase-like protein
MSDNFDVIVLGAGMGGLGCAALLSHAGLKTLVLERNNQIGGRCTSYQKKGCIIDTFVHMFPSCEKGPIGEILNKTEMKDAIKFWHVDPKNKPVLFFGGNAHVYPDLSYASEEDIKALYKGFMMPDEDYQAALRIDNDIYQMPFEKTYALDDITYLTWLTGYSSNPALLSLHNHRSILMGVVGIHEASAGEVIRILQSWHLRRNLGYSLGGGCQAVPDGFAKIIKTYDGVIRTGATVKSIGVEKSRVSGVTLTSGEEIRTRAVVSNAGVKETVLKMFSEAIFSKEYLEYVQHLSCGDFTKLISAAQNQISSIKLLLKEPVIEAPVVWGIPVHVELPPLDAAQVDLNNPEDGKAVLDRFDTYLTIPSNMDPSLAPPGQQLLNFTAVKSLLDEKADIADQVQKQIDVLDLLYPGVAENVLWWDVIKDNAVKAASGRLEPDIVGLAQIVGQVGKNRPSLESPVEGLFFVGADVGQSEIGTILAAESSLRAAPAIVNYLK